MWYTTKIEYPYTFLKNWTRLEAPSGNLAQFGNWTIITFTNPNHDQRQSKNQKKKNRNFCKEYLQTMQQNFPKILKRNQIFSGLLEQKHTLPKLILGLLKQNVHHLLKEIIFLMFS